MTNTQKLLYLHGLGSGSRSAKSELIQRHFSVRGFEVALPSVSLPSLEKLSPELVISTIEREIRASLNQNLVVVGSSFGGFVASHALSRLAPEEQARVRQVVLIAPLFDPWDPKDALLTPERDVEWREKGEYPLADLEKGVNVPVHYKFVEELRRFKATDISFHIPTLVVHGRQDEIVPVQQSEEFARLRPWVHLKILEDGHQLLKDPAGLAALIEAFLRGD
jgi:pimeloyl-ACP methyl ester carboxylesterase